LAENNGNKLNVKLAVENDCLVYSDSVRISQLFYNLVGNAVKFTQNGVINIDVTSVVASKKSVTLLASVSDNGAGIAASDLENIFEEHYQSNNTIGLNVLGIGLGLNLCKEIVTLFHGTIEAESQLGKGTKVSFNIKLQLDKR